MNLMKYIVIICLILVVFFVEVVCECLMVNVCVFGFVNVVWLVKYIVKVISMCGNLLVYYCYFEFLNGDCILCSGINYLVDKMIDGDLEMSW